MTMSFVSLSLHPTSSLKKHLDQSLTAFAMSQYSPFMGDLTNIDEAVLAWGFIGISCRSTPGRGRSADDR
jgi:hypothetical protein